MAIKEAKEKVQDTITLPIDDDSLEGLEEYLSPGSPAEEPKEISSSFDKTDEELYEECEPCHVGDAAAKVGIICEERPEEAGCGCKLISEMVEDENTTETGWIKAIVETAEHAQGEAKEQMVAAIIELTDYLERRNSPLLKELDKDEEETKKVANA
ncbi:hypothetical protein ES705_44624 [subsurface metagenome]